MLLRWKNRNWKNTHNIHHTHMDEQFIAVFLSISREILKKGNKPSRIEWSNIRFSSIQSTSKSSPAMSLNNFSSAVTCGVGFVRCGMSGMI